MSNLSKQLGEYEVNEARDKPIEAFIKANEEPLKKQLEGCLDEVFRRYQQWLEDEGPFALAQESVYRAKNLLKAVLEGDEDAAKALFQTDASREEWAEAGEPWAKVIHGKLHLPESQQLRRLLVEKHADLLRDERIRDLESQLDGVMRQLREANKRLADAGRPTVDW